MKCYAIAAVLALVCTPAFAGWHVCNFDVDADGNVIVGGDYDYWGDFVDYQYAAWGVTFSEVAGDQTGYMNMAYNEQDYPSGLLPGPHSGPNVVHDPDTWMDEWETFVAGASFTVQVNEVGVWFGGDTSGYSQLEAFDGAGNLLGSASASGLYDWEYVSVSSASNIAYVYMTIGGVYDYVAYDDFAFRVVPEPAAMTLIGGILGALALVRRRSK
jgi:hypothetical protein